MGVRGSSSASLRHPTQGRDRVPATHPAEFAQARSRRRFSIPSGVAGTNVRKAVLYAGKNCDPLQLHRLHADKRFVQVYDYVDSYVLMLARMYERRLKGYAAIGYVIEQETIPPPTPV